MPNIRQHYYWSALAFVSLFFYGTTVAMATEIIEPQVLVHDSSEEMLAALRENKEELKEDPEKIYQLVEEILLPNFDFRKMSQLALGKNWRKATEDQKSRFTEEFRLLLIRVYSTAMIEYTEQEIKYLPFKGDLSKKKARVDMEVLQAGGPSIPMTLSLYMNGEAWKVYDVKIDGISLVTNYRTTFSAEIRNHGMDGVINSLAKRNEKVKV